MNAGATAAPRPGLASNVSFTIVVPTISISYVSPEAIGHDVHGVADLAGWPPAS